MSPKSMTGIENVVSNLIELVETMGIHDEVIAGFLNVNSPERLRQLNMSSVGTWEKLSMTGTRFVGNLTALFLTLSFSPDFRKRLKAFHRYHRQDDVKDKVNYTFAFSIHKLLVTGLQVYGF